MSITRRRSIVSKPSFQIKLTIIFMLMVTIVANLVGGLCFLLMSSEDVRTVLERLATSPDNVGGIPMQQIAVLFIPKILGAEGIALVVVFMLCIWVTHTIAGPVHRMEKIASAIGDGDLSIFARLRAKDEFQELADAFNVMSRGLAKKIYELRDIAERLDGGKNDGRTTTELREALAGFTLPDRSALAPGAEDDLYSDADIEAASDSETDIDPAPAKAPAAAAAPAPAAPVQAAKTKAPGQPGGSKNSKKKSSKGRR